MADTRAVTTVKNPPNGTLVEGSSYTLDVNSATHMRTGLVLEVYPQQTPEVTKAKRKIIILVTGLSGAQITFTISSLPAGATIGATDVLAFAQLPLGIATYTAPASTSSQELQGVNVTSTPGASSGIVRAFVVVLTSNPTANQGAVDASAIMAFVYHTAGNFTQNVLRAVGGTVTQQIAGTISEARGLEGVVAVSSGGGTITGGVGVDSTWSMAGGVMTSWVAFRSRQGNAGAAPTAEYGIICYGYNQFVGPVVIGSLTSPTNVSLALLSAITVTAGAALGLSIANSFTAIANSDTFYGININQAIIKGAFTGLVYYGISLLAPAASGAGTVATAAQLYLELPTIATNNYFMRFAGTLDATAAGAYQGRIKVLTSAGTGYISVNAA